jgi:microsomal dipeptidase-like Zn-dependent dipeptidase
MTGPCSSDAGHSPSVPISDQGQLKVRIATSVDQIDAITGAGSFAIVLHMEGADGIDADLLELEAMNRSGLRSLGLVWSRPNIFGHGVPFAWPPSPELARMDVKLERA